MISYIDQDCNIEIRGSIMGLGSLEYNIQGSGYGDLISLIYKAVTKGLKESLIDRMENDYIRDLVEQVRKNAPTPEAYGGM